MSIRRSDIEKALDELTSNFEGIRFQRLAVMLAKQRFPDLVASEPMQDLGADAVGSGKVLICSLTAALPKLRSDAAKIQQSFEGIARLIFATPRAVSNRLMREWTNAVRDEFGYELELLGREDIVASLTDPSNLALCHTYLGLPGRDETPVNELTSAIHRAVCDLAEGWSAPLPGMPLIELRSARIGKENREREIFGLAGISDLLRQGKRVTLEAPPGGGKTTTLIQIARSLGAAGCIPFLIDLPSWIGSGLELLDYIASRQAFQTRELSAAKIARLHNDLEFQFLLNGWNEIGDGDAARAVRLVRDLDHNFPKAGIAVATRAHYLFPPLRDAIRLEILGVSGDARARYLAERLGERGPLLRSMLDNNGVLDELTKTPLILSEVTALFDAGIAIPDTKMGVLDAAVRLHEKTEQHASFLEAPPLSGRASVYLAALAEAMTWKGGTSLSDNDAREVAGTTLDDLKSAKQVRADTEPSTILHTLSGHHLLVPGDDKPVSYRFVHQQFQEFYVAATLKQWLLALAESEDPQRILLFTKRYVNDLRWDEPLRMLAAFIGKDRNQDPHLIQSGAALVEMALRCDLVFAAELAYLCGPEVWKQAGRAVADQLRLLYSSPEKHDRERAFAGMLASGSADFREIVLAVLTSQDQQVRLTSYRGWREFHLSSLGEDWQEVVRRWTVAARAEFMSELIHFGKAARSLIPFALADDSIEVRVAAFSAFAWVAPPEEVASKSAEVDDQTFDAVMSDFPAEWVHASIRARALKSYWRSYRKSSDPVRMLKLLMEVTELGAAPIDELKAALNQLEPDKLRDLGHFVIKPVVEVIRKTDATWVSEWIARHIFDQRLSAENWLDYVCDAPSSLNEEFFDSLQTTNRGSAHLPGSVPMLVKFADPALVERLFKKLCQLRDALANTPFFGHEQEFAVERQLEGVFSQLPMELIIRGISPHLVGEINSNELAVVIRRLSRVGQHGPDDLRGSLKEDARHLLRAYLTRAVFVVLEWPDDSGTHMAQLASALSRVGEPDDIGLLKKLISRDIERMKAQRASFPFSRRRAAGTRIAE